MELNPYVHIKVLNQTKGYCILVRLIPRITYHTDQKFLDLMHPHGYGDIRESL